MSDLIDSASVLIIRDNVRTGKMEVLLVRRHDDIDFAGGAYVFPGGKRDTDDQMLKDYGVLFSSDYGEVMSTAIREVYEESGMVIGKIDAIPHEFKKLKNKEITITEFINSAGAKIFRDHIIPFARWVTPNIYSKRFDPRFFLAKAPINQIAVPDNNEIVETVWAEPLGFIEKNHKKMIFPTIMNLNLLSQARSVEEAMEITRARKIVTVEPEIVNGKRIIDPNAGYGEIDQTNIHPGVRAYKE
jgi:8-oxo-dGTP pyrophosphatase MutT (NUDIX family)